MVFKQECLKLIFIEFMVKVCYMKVTTYTNHLITMIHENWVTVSWTMPDRQTYTYYNHFIHTIVVLLVIVLEKQTKPHRYMHHESKIKFRWNLPDRHVHLTIISYTSYRCVITYRIKKTDQTITNLTLTKIQVWWNLPIHLKNFPHCKYSLTIAFSIWDMDLTTKS